MALSICLAAGIFFLLTKLRAEEKVRLSENQYNWASLSGSGCSLRYADSNWETDLGVDVSTFQGKVDWAKVKAAGAKFAMIRTGYRGSVDGGISEDDCFKTNADGASKAGLGIGFYFYSQAVTEKEAREEAAFVLKRISGYKVTYPVAFDFEEAGDSSRAVLLTAEERTKIALAFCEVIEKQGYTPIIYGNSSWLQSSYTMTKLMKYEVWTSDYSAPPEYPYVFRMWQFTDCGSISGIKGKVDLNLWFREK